MSLGTTITRLRTERGLSQGELAEALEVSRQSVSKWETDGSVPELEKLIRLSDLFGVTLDQLVRGGGERETEAEQDAGGTDGASPPQVSEAIRNHTPEGFSGRRVAGTVLFCLAFLTVLVTGFLGGILEGLILALPFVVCGIICFACRRRPGLWCAWAVFAMADLFLRFAAGTSWGVVYLTLHYPEGMNRAHLIMGWAILAWALVMVVATARSWRDISMAPTRRNLYFLLAGAAVWLLLPWIGKGLTAILGAVTASILAYGTALQLASVILDWLRLGLLAALLTAGSCFLRGRRTAAKP